MGKQSELIQGSGKIVLVVTKGLIRANTNMNFKAVGAVAKFKRNSVSVEGRQGSQVPARGSLTSDNWLKRSLFSTVFKTHRYCCFPVFRY